MSESLEIRVSGMSCASCVARVEKGLRKVPGVIDASVNLATEKARVHVDPKIFQEETLIPAISKMGFGGEWIREEQSSKPDDLGHLKIRLIFSAALTIPLVLPMLNPSGHWMLPGLWQLLLAAPIQFIIGARFYRSAFLAVKAKSGNMDLLVALGTSAAFFLSVYHLFVVPKDGSEMALYFESSAVIITLVLLGKYWEAKAKRETTKAIRSLEALRPDKAWVRRESGDLELPLQMLVKGDVLIVKAGERIAADGRILEGNSFVDESMLSGESMPSEKSSGSTVSGGTVNGDGLLLVKIEAIGHETILAKMIRLLEDAQAEKPKIQLLVDRISAVFVPVIILIGVATFAFWAFQSTDWEMALLRAVSVLVIACPCALGLATPTAIMVGTGMAARFGILIRDPEAIDAGNKLTAIVFDKTGTLTEGKAKLVSYFTEEDRDSFLKTCLAIQSASEHPLAKALIREFPDFPFPISSDVQTLPGRGMSGSVDGRRIVIGNRRLMEDRSIELDTYLSRLEDPKLDGLSLSLVADEDARKILGYFAFSDAIKDSAPAAIKALKEQTVDIHLLSGDNAPAVKAVAKTLAISNFEANLTPVDKLARVKALKAEGKNKAVIAMVGDGINDAPALAAADLSFAMGSGTDVAMHAASITLMRSDLRLIPDALKLCQLMNLKIKQNLFWAFLYNVIGVPLAAMGYLNPALAAAAMAMSSVSVVGNSLTLRLWKATAAK